MWGKKLMTKPILKKYILIEINFQCKDIKNSESTCHLHKMDPMSLKNALLD